MIHGASIRDGLRPGTRIFPFCFRRAVWYPIDVLAIEETAERSSALNAMEAAREAEADVRLVACVVDRGEGGAEEFAARGVPFHALFHIREFL